MPKKKRNAKDAKIEELTLGLINNGDAKITNKKSKKWTVQDIRVTKPMNYPQEEMFKYFLGDEINIVADGSAGTGKTYSAIYLALNKLLSIETSYKKIIIVRNTVATRDMGFLPGSIDEKMAAYELPYMDTFGSILGRNSSYSDMKEQGLVEFMSTSYIRGLNWDDSIIIVDEVQNLNFHEINSVLTRVGSNSRIIIVGDYLQSDLNKNPHDVSGMNKFLSVVETMDNFETIKFKTEDIIRSDFVKEWIVAVEEFNNK